MRMFVSHSLRRDVWPRTCKERQSKTYPLVQRHFPPRAALRSLLFSTLCSTVCILPVKARVVLKLLTLVIALSVGIGSAFAGSAVVTDGRFTNVYVYPDPDKETWEQHMALLRPSDAAQFSRAAIDGFTATLMSPAWPSYFDPLVQYSGIHPPGFFGSSVASKDCVDAALKDRNNGVIEWATVRSLANCHISGMDPSPQVNLIFSPDIRLATIPTPFGVGTGPEMCTGATSTIAYHAWGLNTPNFTVLPTSQGCVSNFADFTKHMSHEVVETISDPAGAGMGTIGQDELADNCENKSDGYTTVSGFLLARYWSNFDNDCEPRLDPPAGSISATWVLAQGSPVQRFTGSVHTLNLTVPAARLTTDAQATEVLLVTQTGGDDLRGGSNPGDNANVTLNFTDGSTTTVNVNNGRSWENGQTHAVRLLLPATPMRVSDITGVTISTQFGGGLSGDNWNVDKVALVVAFPTGSITSEPPPKIVHEWLDVSGGPLIRFTGSVHDLVEGVPPQDVGEAVSALDLTISTGNDDLRGGNNAGDNCDVIIELTNGKSIAINNVNAGSNWKDWTDHTVGIPLPNGGLSGGDVASVKLHTGFGGGIGGDNWNVNRI